MRRRTGEGVARSFVAPTGEAAAGRVTRVRPSGRSGVEDLDDVAHVDRPQFIQRRMPRPGRGSSPPTVSDVKMIPQMSNVKRMSNDAIVDLAALLGIAVRDNAEMDQILRRYGFLAGAPETIRKKANHLVSRVADSTEIDEASREQMFLDLAARAQKNGRRSSAPRSVLRRSC
jgi:hypothetical protein